MRELSNLEVESVSGGFNLGMAIFGIIGGFLMGGPVGAGMAAAAVIGGEGVNNLKEMYDEEKRNR